MKVTIETYRGFEIYFDTNTEKFQCEVGDEKSKESASYPAVKKYIDDYLKDNSNFKPFWIVGNPTSYRNKEHLKVIGVRKDGRYIAEGELGIKRQISDFSLSDYILKYPENDNAFKQLEELLKEEERLRGEIMQRRKDIISSMKIVTLKDYKYR